MTEGGCAICKPARPACLEEPRAQRGILIGQQPTSHVGIRHLAVCVGGGGLGGRLVGKGGRVGGQGERVGWGGVAAWGGPQVHKHDTRPARASSWLR